MVLDPSFSRPSIKRITTPQLSHFASTSTVHENIIPNTVSLPFGTSPPYLFPPAISTSFSVLLNLCNLDQNAQTLTTIHHLDPRSSATKKNERQGVWYSSSPHLSISIYTSIGKTSSREANEDANKQTKEQKMSEHANNETRATSLKQKPWRKSKNLKEICRRHTQREIERRNQHALGIQARAVSKSQAAAAGPSSNGSRWSPSSPAVKKPGQEGFCAAIVAEALITWLCRD